MEPKAGSTNVALMIEMPAASATKPRAGERQFGSVCVCVCCLSTCARKHMPMMVVMVVVVAADAVLPAVVVVDANWPMQGERRGKRRYERGVVLRRCIYTGSKH